ncbi:MAG TPA: hypothetical protein ENJ73_02915 [Desulfobacterales bacterium]|nr:hypothetical protein [Desulfobacterales bacterium]
MRKTNIVLTALAIALVLGIAIQASAAWVGAPATGSLWSGWFCPWDASYGPMMGTGAGAVPGGWWCW